MSHESSNSHVPTHSGAAASSSTTTTRVGSCAASRARVKARATSSGEFRRRVRALTLRYLFMLDKVAESGRLSNGRAELRALMEQ